MKCHLSPTLIAHLDKMVNRCRRRPTQEVYYYLTIHRDGEWDANAKAKISTLRVKQLHGKDQNDYLINELDFYWSVSGLNDLSADIVKIKTNSIHSLYLYEISSYLAQEIDGQKVDIKNNRLNWTEKF